MTNYYKFRALFFARERKLDLKEERSWKWPTVYLYNLKHFESIITKNSYYEKLKLIANKLEMTKSQSVQFERFMEMLFNETVYGKLVSKLEARR